MTCNGVRVLKRRSAVEWLTDARDEIAGGHVVYVRDANATLRLDNCNPTRRTKERKP